MENQLVVQEQLKQYSSEYSEKNYKYPSLQTIKAFDNEELSSTFAKLEGVKKQIDNVLEVTMELGKLPTENLEK